WLTADGREMTTADWTSAQARTLGALLFAAKQPTTTSVEDDLFVLLLSADPAAISFVLPAPKLHGQWQVVFDTARPEQADDAIAHPVGKPYPLSPRSFVLLHDA
ncbi:MAG TPA: hypothetical protein VES39_02930, partial [Rhodospirillales bacterium]|nr:hypothetical protein [Rhodospirillales bacterium]